MEAVQTCAMFNDLCVGKTGTLTTAKLTVRQFQLGNAYNTVSPSDSWTMKDGMTDQIKDQVVQSIVALSDVRLVPDDDARFEAKGTPLEKGMINFLMDNDIRTFENDGRGYTHEYDCPNMLKYVNDIRPKQQMLPFD